MWLHVSNSTFRIEYSLKQPSQFCEGGGTKLFLPLSNSDGSLESDDWTGLQGLLVLQTHLAPSWIFQKLSGVALTLVLCMFRQRKQESRANVWRFLKHFPLGLDWTGASPWEAPTFFFVDEAGVFIRTHRASLCLLIRGPVPLSWNSGISNTLETVAPGCRPSFFWRVVCWGQEMREEWWWQCDSPGYSVKHGVKASGWLPTWGLQKVGLGADVGTWSGLCRPV